MVVGTFNQGCEIAVIGGGPAGYTAALLLARTGHDVLLIEERATLGGVCLNEGCIPTKALLQATAFLEQCKISERMGITIAQPRVELSKMIAWKNTVVGKLTGGVATLVKHHGITLMEGRAQFLNDRQLTVTHAEGKTLVDFQKAVIATGSRPNVSQFPNLNEKLWTAREALDAKNIPSKILILGAGYEGIEFASYFSRLGAKVYLTATDELLSFEDKDLLRAVKKILKKLKVTLLTTHTVAQAQPGADTVTVQLRHNTNGKTTTVEVEQLLLCNDRTPNTQGLALDHIPLKTDKLGFIQVNDRMETSIPGIYAVGDVTGSPFLAHRAYRHAKIAVAVINEQPDSYDIQALPTIIYTLPEVAYTGLSEAQAQELGYQVRTSLFPMRANGRALTMNQSDGFIKIISDKDSGLILGVVIVAPSASELIAEACMAIEMGAFVDDAALIIHGHPTISECFMEAAEMQLGKVVHTLPSDK